VEELQATAHQLGLFHPLVSRVRLIGSGVKTMGSFGTTHCLAGVDVAIRLMRRLR